MHKKEHDVHSRIQEFYVCNQVLAKNFLDGDKWVPGVIVERKGPLSYIVQIRTGTQWRRHIDQLQDGSEIKEGDWNKVHQDGSTGKHSEVVQVPAQSCKHSEVVQVPCKHSKVVQVPAQPCKQSEAVQGSTRCEEDVSMLPSEAAEAGVKGKYIPSSSTILDRQEVSQPVPEMA